MSVSARSIWPAPSASASALRAISGCVGCDSARAASSAAERAWSPFIAAARAARYVFAGSPAVAVPDMRAVADAGTSTSTASAAPFSHLHVRVIGASTAFGCDPVDILGRVLDVTRLAVDAILGVDLEPRFTVLALHEFVHARRTITLFGPSIYRKVDGGGYVRVLERQMNRLVFLVIGVGHEHR